MSRKIIFDCDPGIDDAIAILAAVPSPEIEILALTTTAGNVPLETTSRNALDLVHFVNADIPVYAGAQSPLVEPAEGFAADIHGETGLRGVTLERSPSLIEKGHAVEYIIRALRQERLSILATGPLTNIALALQLVPDITSQIEEIVLMGGSAWTAGNVTASAEFNFWFDPHAADIVMRSDVPKTMLGLNATHQLQVKAPDIARLRKEGRASIVAADLLENYAFGDPYLHDPCALAYLLAPELFGYFEAAVEVETESKLTKGLSVIFAGKQLEGRKATTKVVDKVKRDAVLDLLWARIAELD